MTPPVASALMKEWVTHLVETTYWLVLCIMYILIFFAPALPYLSICLSEWQNLRPGKEIAKIKTKPK